MAKAGERYNIRPVSVRMDDDLEGVVRRLSVIMQISISEVIVRLCRSTIAQGRIYDAMLGDSVDEIADAVKPIINQS